jgi:hypothetical protein
MCTPAAEEEDYDVMYTNNGIHTTFKNPAALNL